DELIEYFAEIADKMQDHFNTNVIEQLQQHVKQKDYIMLVSGAFTPLLTAVCKHLHFDIIIGTDIPFNGQAIAHPQTIEHIQGQRKNEKILKALKNYTIDWENSYAYSDSYSELSVIQLIGTTGADSRY